MNYKYILISMIMLLFSAYTVSAGFSDDFAVTKQYLQNIQVRMRLGGLLHLDI